MGAWDPDEVRRLFTSLEFRSLLRPAEGGGRGREAEGRGGGARPPAAWSLRSSPASSPTARWASRSRRTTTGWSGWRCRPAAPRPPTRPSTDPARSPTRLADASAREVDPRRQGARAASPSAAGAVSTGVAFDTMLAGYLLDPGAADYPLARPRRALPGRRRPRRGRGGATRRVQLFAEEPWRTRPRRPRRSRCSRPSSRSRSTARVSGRCWRTSSCRSSSVLARMEARGVRLDVAYLEEMGGGGPRPHGDLARGGLRARRAGVQPELAAAAARGPLRRARPPAGEEDAQGRAVHRRQRPGEAPRRAPDRRRAPVVARARQAQLHVPRGAAQAGRRDATAASTRRSTRPWPRRGRLSTSNPNLQNIPVRSELGRQIRRAFIPGADDQVLLVADYSQIELRVLAHLSGDDGLREAFDARTRHPRGHRGDGLRPAARAGRRGAPPAREDRQLRPRLRDERLGSRHSGSTSRRTRRRRSSTRYFDGFPTIQDYLRDQVDRATAGRVHRDPPRPAPVHPRAPAATGGCATSASGRR